MKAIHIANAKKLDAEVAIEIQPQRSRIRTVLPDGSDKVNVKILKSTVATEMQVLAEKYGDNLQVLEALLESDPEVDTELTGKKLRHTRKLYVDQNNRIAYSLNLYRVIRQPDGEEKERRDLNKVPANVNAEIPLQWTGKRFPKEEAIRQFVFGRKYQLRHVNGVTYDFLYSMAKELEDSKSLILVGAGAKANQPLLLTRGGQSYRGFLEGRTDGDKYCLILHLTDIELKGL